jgi:two-component system CheB/CheR fusion protein
VAAARVGAVDLVLSDLGLPDGSGLDLMRQLSREFGLPGVAISGYGMEDDVRHAREAGFFAHLTKPVNFQQVQAVIGQFAAEKERG